MTEKIKLVIISTHPIQYHIPWYQGIAADGRIDLKVYYAVIPDAQQQSVGFNVPFQWDIPMLEGYRWQLLPNVAKSPGLGCFSACDVPNISDYFHSDRPDAVLLTGWHSKVLLQALWTARRLRIPCIVRGESNIMRPRATWKKLLHRLLLCNYDRFLAIGRLNRAFYLQAGVAAERIHNCGYFIDNERFAAEAAKLLSSRAALREQWAIPRNTVCFLYAGKLQAKKRPLDLIEALAEARAKGIDCHLLIVGDGELMAAVRHAVESENLPVSFAGFLNQSQIIAAYVAADCLVLPSDNGETWGLVVNEAMACGLPAIISDRVGCGPDLIETGVTGDIYPMGNCSALAEKLAEFAANRDNLPVMGQNAQRRVIESYSVQQAVQATVDAVLAAAGKHH